MINRREEPKEQSGDYLPDRDRGKRCKSLEGGKVRHMVHFQQDYLRLKISEVVLLTRTRHAIV